MDEFRPSSKENLQVSWEGVCIFEKVEVPEFSLGCGRQPFGRCSFQKKSGFLLRELFSLFDPVLGLLVLGTNFLTTHAPN
jgi:hypothetical protein